MLSGAMDRVGASVLITLKLIDVKRAAVERRESERLRGATEEAALDAVNALFRRMFGQELAAARAGKAVGATGRSPSPGDPEAGTGEAVDRSCSAGAARAW